MITFILVIVCSIVLAVIVLASTDGKSIGQRGHAYRGGQLPAVMPPPPTTPGPVTKTSDE